MATDGDKTAITRQHSDASQQTDLTALPVPTPTAHMGIGLWITATLCFGTQGTVTDVKSSPVRPKTAFLPHSVASSVGIMNTALCRRSHYKSGSLTLKENTQGVHVTATLWFSPVGAGLQYELCNS